MRLILQIIRLRARIRIQVLHDLDAFHGLECSLPLNVHCCECNALTPTPFPKGEGLSLSTMRFAP
jgi:hypothetical protein